MTGKLLQEEKQLSARDLKLKVQKLDIYIKKAERRIAAHEKKLERCREKKKSETRLIKERLTV